MQETQWKLNRERDALLSLAQKEDLAEKKANIHARLLMDPGIAKRMEEVALQHKKRKEHLLELALGKGVKKINEHTMSALTDKKEEK